MVNIYVSGGPGRKRLVWDGVTYSKEALRTELAKRKPKINVFFSGKQPQHLHYIIAPDDGLSKTSKEIQRKHPESTLMTWDEFASEHLSGVKPKKKKSKLGGNKSIKKKKIVMDDSDIAPMPTSRIRMTNSNNVIKATKSRSSELLIKW